MVNIFKTQPREIVDWRKQNGASLRETAEHFGCSVATVTRAERLIKLSDKPPGMSQKEINKLRESLEVWLHGLLDLQAEFGPNSVLDLDSSIANTRAILADLGKPGHAERVAKMLGR